MKIKIKNPILSLSIKELNIADMFVFEVTGEVFIKTDQMRDGFRLLGCVNLESGQFAFYPDTTKVFVITGNLECDYFKGN